MLGRVILVLIVACAAGCSAPVHDAAPVHDVTPLPSSMPDPTQPTSSPAWIQLSSDCYVHEAHDGLLCGHWAIHADGVLVYWRATFAPGGGNLSGQAREEPYLGDVRSSLVEWGLYNASMDYQVDEAHAGLLNGTEMAELRSAVQAFKDADADYPQPPDAYDDATFHLGVLDNGTWQRSTAYGAGYGARAKPFQTLYSAVLHVDVGLETRLGLYWPPPRP